MRASAGSVSCPARQRAKSVAEFRWRERERERVLDRFYLYNVTVCHIHVWYLIEPYFHHTAILWVYLPLPVLLAGHRGQCFDVCCRLHCCGGKLRWRRSQLWSRMTNVGIATINHPPFITISMGGINHKWVGFQPSKIRVVYDIAIPTLQNDCRMTAEWLQIRQIWPDIHGASLSLHPWGLPTLFLRTLRPRRYARPCLVLPWTLQPLWQEEALSRLKSDKASEFDGPSSHGSSIWLWQELSHHNNSYADSNNKSCRSTSWILIAGTWIDWILTLKPYDHCFLESFLLAFVSCNDVQYLPGITWVRERPLHVSQMPNPHVTSLDRN